MHLMNILSSLVLATTSFAAPALDRRTQGVSVIVNHCTFPVWVADVASTWNEKAELSTGQQWAKALYYDPTVGPALKVFTRENGPTTFGDTLVLGYSLNDAENSIYYSLDTVNGYGFGEEKVVVHGSKPDFIPIVWNSPPTQPSGTKRYVGDTDLVLELCAP